MGVKRADGSSFYRYSFDLFLYAKEFQIQNLELKTKKGDKSNDHMILFLFPATKHCCFLPPPPTHPKYVHPPLYHLLLPLPQKSPTERRKK
jgi:hypothetical protein